MPFDLNQAPQGSLPWLRREIGGTLGYGYDPHLWGHEQISRVDSYIQAGLLQFYFPSPVKPPEDKSPTKPHTWSFLTPRGELAIVAGQSTYDLPANFAGPVGDIILALANGDESKRITISPDTSIRQLQTNNPMAGTPRYASVSTKPSDGSAAQQYEILFYPTPDVDGTATLDYSIVPDPLTPERPFPLGGKQQSNVILQSCLAIAEERLTGKHGPAFENYNTALLSAISWDMRSLQPTEDQIWPIENPADGLKINRAYLKRLIGAHRDCGPHPGAWSHHEANEVEVIIQTGLRKFYHPMVLPGEKTRHEWSFLRPRGKLTLQADVSTYALPENLSSIISPINFDQDDSSPFSVIQIKGESQVMGLLQRNASSGRPYVACERIQTPSTGTSTRYELLVYPIPDGEYIVNFSYQMNPQAGTEDTELPHGGQQHAQTIIESCLAASEEHDGKQGIHSQLFAQQLQASVAHDRRAASTGSLGYNHEPTSEAEMHGMGDSIHGWSNNLVTYNGNIID